MATQTATVNLAADQASRLFAVDLMQSLEGVRSGARDSLDAEADLTLYLHEFVKHVKACDWTPDYSFEALANKLEAEARRHETEARRLHAAAEAISNASRLIASC